VFFTAIAAILPCKTDNPMQSFAHALKHWRHTRRLSQLDLALEADVSARHLAFLETGRAQPSRAMLLHLAEVLALPRADRNNLLQLAGFAPVYPALPLDDAAMAAVRTAMDWMMSRHAPYPAVIMDRLWRLVALNAPASVMFAGIGLAQGDSLLDAIRDPQGARNAIENWAEVGHHTMIRLRTESAAAGGIAELDAAALHLAQDPAVAGWQAPSQLPAIVPTIYVAHGLRLSLLSTYATFGSAEEVALRDIKIELMFPADDTTRESLVALSAGAS
jgi:transcriptional regulator with XRE-family HTH domain